MRVENRGFFSQTEYRFHRDAVHLWDRNSSTATHLDPNCDIDRSTTTAAAAAAATCNSCYRRGGPWGASCASNTRTCHALNLRYGHN